MSTCCVERVHWYEISAEIASKLTDQKHAISNENPANRPYQSPTDK